MSDSIWDLPEFKPFADQWQTRLKQLEKRRSYYTGTAYQSLAGQLGWLYARLAPQIKPLYMPCARAVDIDAGIIPGGWALAEDAPPVWSEAIKQIHAWSRWATRGVLLIHYGAQMGLSGLKVCDDREKKQVKIEPLDPRTFIKIRSRLYEQEADLVIICEERHDETGKPFEYGEVISTLTVRTFKNGIPARFDGRELEYKNELGAVPVFEVRHIETGDPLGECTYDKAAAMLDELNGLASQLARIIDKHAEPQWAIFGADQSDLIKDGDNVWFFPQGADGKPLVAPIDIRGVLTFIQTIAANVKESLPELSFDDLRRQAQIATATVELQLIELVLKVKRCRPNYDAAYIAALRLAGMAGVQMGLADIAVLNDPLLALDDLRPVLPLDPLTRIAIEQAQQNLEQTRGVSKQ